MGRSKHQSSNGVVGTGDSSESDGSQNEDKFQNSSKPCPHANKSIDQNQVKRGLNLEDIFNNNFCQHCSKGTTQGEDIYVCLKCGAKACSKEHSKLHYDTPRSALHSLTLNLSDKAVWCHDCELLLEVASIKKLKSCVENVKNMHEKHIKRPTNKNTPKIEPIAEECETESKPAVPILPPKTKYGSQAGVKGLMNLGNTCYFNSVLQCLAQTPNLIETLREMSENKEVSVELDNGRTLSGLLEKQDIMCGELAETLFNIKGPGSAISPHKVLNLLRNKVHQFRGNDQHDSHELLRHLLESVRCADLKRYRRIMLNELGLNGGDIEKVDVEKQKELKQIDREVTDKIMLVPDQVFKGFLVSRLECQDCNHSSECIESFLDLSLPVTSERPHPPSIRRKSGINEEKGGSQLSKHQLRKQRMMRKSRVSHNKKSDLAQGDPVPSISEKGESDAEGDDADVDSEESDKKTETRDTCHEEKTLCVGIPISTARLNTNNSNPQVLSLTRSSIEDLDRSSVVIPLTEEGVPDISKVSIYDSSQPKLKTYMRDSETIAKEEPSWLIRLHELPELHENGNFQIACGFINDHCYTSNFKATENINGKSEKLEKDEEISSDDKTIIGENSVETNNDTAEWIRRQEATPSWDDPFVAPPPPPEPLHNNTDHLNDNGANSDDDAMMGGLFEENNTAEGSNDCSVQSCLGQFTAIELMAGSNKVGCEVCTQRANKGKKDGKTIYTASTKRLLISEAPPVLILHIKRFQVQMSSFRKLSRHVAFPLELDITPFCKVDKANNAPKKLRYSLYGIVEHSGNFSGGHYVAYVKVEDSWFYISDSHVSEVNESRVLSAQAYLLFYKSS